MYGYRARLGFILACSNGVLESEAPRLVPEGVSCHYTRVRYSAPGTEEGALSIIDSTEAGARLLAGGPETIGVDVICLNHGTATYAMGPKTDRVIMERIEKAAGVKATTSSTAIVNGLRKLGAKRISFGVAFEYPPMNMKMREFFEAEGFDVVSIAGTHITPPPPEHNHRVVSSQPPTSAYKLIKTAYRPDVDAVVVTNANLRSIEVLSALERDLNKPVITANQAAVWDCLRRAGITDPVKGFGRLLEL